MFGPGLPPTAVSKGAGREEVQNVVGPHEPEHASHASHASPLDVPDIAEEVAPQASRE